MTYCKGNPKKHVGHRTLIVAVLCLFGLCTLASTLMPSRRTKKTTDNKRVYLIHSDVLRRDRYGTNTLAQIATGHVHFRHDGADLYCDSAYFYQEANSMKAFGNVRYKQGDTLSLTCKYADYDGMEQLMEARHNVVLKHRKQTLYADSLNYDRMYNNAYFFEGGELVDGKDNLVADWGGYNTATRKAVFYYNVKMKNDKQTVITDTLHYDTQTSTAHVTGPSTITSDNGVIKTTDAYTNSKTNQSQLFSRSTIVDKEKTIVGDSIYHNSENGDNEGFGNVVYVDTHNKNSLKADHVFYNDKTGYGYATKNVLLKDYSQSVDTLYLHADSLKLFTYNINTDSVYREAHAFKHVRAYRSDLQAVCDSLVSTSIDSCMTMYQDPIVWNGERQLIGEVIKVYMNDSTIREAQVIGQALSIELLDKKEHYDQVSSRQMNSYFDDGKIRRIICTGNVKSIYYVMDSKDSTLTNLNYMETDTMKVYLSPERKLEKIWVPKAVGTMYPITQIPPSKYKLPEFVWFDYIRPLNKDDIFEWRGKKDGNKLIIQKRQSVPLQHLKGSGTTENTDNAQTASDSDKVTMPEETVNNDIENKVSQ